MSLLGWVSVPQCEPAERHRHVKNDQVWQVSCAQLGRFQSAPPGAGKAQPRVVVDQLRHGFDDQFVVVGPNGIELWSNDERLGGFHEETEIVFSRRSEDVDAVVLAGALHE